MGLSFEFREELKKLLNKHSIDHECITPDFMLVDLLCDFLQSYALFVGEREKWFGRGPTVTQPSITNTGGTVDNIYHQ